MNALVGQNARQVAIDRRSELAVENVYATHLTAPGLPVIVTDALSQWPARSTWSFDFFRENYGSQTVVPRIGIYGKSRRVMKLCHFIDYVESPLTPPRGFWIDTKTGLPREPIPEDAATPLYLYDQNLFLEHAELLADVTPNPECIDDWLSLLPQSFQELLQSTRYYQRGLLIGPTNSLSTLHYDFLHTHAYLAQIVGRKLCVLFSPDDSALLYDGNVNPERPQPEKFPLFRDATPFTCILEPGEVLIIPCGWWHYVRNLEATITVNYNFFNRTNFGPYVTDVFRVLPQILAGFDRNPDLRAKLGIDWQLADG